MFFLYQMTDIILQNMEEYSICSTNYSMPHI